MGGGGEGGGGGDGGGTKAGWAFAAEAEAAAAALLADGGAGGTMTGGGGGEGGGGGGGDGEGEAGGGAPPDEAAADAELEPGLEDAAEAAAADPDDASSVRTAPSPSLSPAEDSELRVSRSATNAAMSSNVRCRMRRICSFQSHVSKLEQGALTTRLHEGYTGASKSPGDAHLCAVAPCPRSRCREAPRWSAAALSPPTGGAGSPS